MAEVGSVLVTGAGGKIGNVGGKIVGLLRERGFAVRAMAYHDDDRVEALRSLGAEVVELAAPGVAALEPRAAAQRVRDAVERATTSTGNRVLLLTDVDALLPSDDATAARMSAALMTDRKSVV